MCKLRAACHAARHCVSCITASIVEHADSTCSALQIMHQPASRLQACGKGSVPDCCGCALQSQKAVKTAGVQTEVHAGFTVLQTENMAETLRLYRDLTHAMQVSLLGIQGTAASACAVPKRMQQGQQGRLWG